MKKLLLGICIIFAGIFSINAQSLLTENFEGSMTNMPVAWDTGVFSHHPGNPGWQFANAWPSHGNSLWLNNTATHTYCAYVDDIDFDYTGAWNNTTAVVCYDSLKTSVINCGAAANVFIGFDLNYNNYTNGEVGTIAVSIDGGVTWTTAVTLPIYSGDISWYNGQIYDITAQAAGHANVKVAFCWNNAGAVSAGYCGWGMAVDNVSIYVPSQYDLSTQSQSNAYLMQVGTGYNFTGSIYNFGSSAITSMHMNYKVGSAPAVSQTISGIAGFNKLSSYNWSMNSTSSTFTPVTPGNITVKFWADNLNGANADANNANDTLVANFMVVDSIQPKMVAFEEFSCASCDPCLYAMTNIDTVSEKNAAICNTVRYHWYFPGQDMINQETSTLVNSRFETYYGQNGVPVGEIDGAYYYPGAGYLSSAVIQNEAAFGSPIKIDVYSATYNPTNKTFNLQATIKSYGTIPAGLTAQVILTEDSVNFKTDQSVEDPQSYFAPPIGSGAGNDDPDWMYPLVLNFPDAVEDMLPSVNGTTLGAFTPGSSQSINVKWVQNHPWAAKRASYPYDSTLTQHFTILVQSNSGNAGLGLPAKYILQSKRVLINVATGIDEITNGVSFNMYPNPTNNNTSLAFELAKDQNVTVQVYNMLGQQVYSDNQGMVSSGQHTIAVNTSALQNGVYFVRFNTDNTSTTQKLVIQK